MIAFPPGGDVAAMPAALERIGLADDAEEGGDANSLDPARASPEAVSDDLGPIGANCRRPRRHR